MKKGILLIILSLMIIGIAACGQAVSGQVLQSDKPRETSPVASETDMATLVSGNNAFAFDLYRVLSKNESNLFYSPYSISAALAMTYAGARGETEKDTADAMRFILSKEKLHPSRKLTISPVKKSTTDSTSDFSIPFS